MKLTESDLKTGFAATVLLLVGTLMLVMGANLSPGWRATLANNVGAFIIASVVLALIWQYWQVRGFLQDMFKKAGIAENLQRARITHFFTSFHAGVPWDELFANAKTLDILFAYGATWRNTNQQRLERHLRQADAKLRVVLPDPTNDIVVQELAQRFGHSPEHLRQRITDATDYFRQLGESLPGTVTVFHLGRTLSFTFYRFSTAAVIATYRHTPGREPVITLVCDREGELYEWIRAEWYGITEHGVKDGLTRQVYPEPAQGA